MKALILIVLIFSLVVGCMDVVMVEKGRKQIAKDYPECANLSPGETLDCKQRVDAREGREVKERPKIDVKVNEWQR